MRLADKSNYLLYAQNKSHRDYVLKYLIKKHRFPKIYILLDTKSEPIDIPEATKLLAISSTTLDRHMFNLLSDKDYLLIVNLGSALMRLTAQHTLLPVLSSKLGTIVWNNDVALVMHPNILDTIDFTILQAKCTPDNKALMYSYVKRMLNITQFHEIADKEDVLVVRSQDGTTEYGYLKPKSTSYEINIDKMVVEV